MGLSLTAQGSARITTGYWVLSVIEYLQENTVVHRDEMHLNAAHVAGYMLFNPRMCSFKINKYVDKLGIKRDYANPSNSPN